MACCSLCPAVFDAGMTEVMSALNGDWACQVFQTDGAFALFLKSGQNLACVIRLGIKVWAQVGFLLKVSSGVSFRDNQTHLYCGSPHPSWKQLSPH